ncbi:MAG TPA: fibronectin type III domain-containing protein, partial [Bryobacterales bacterium]|nr:fibronectin type III domain-containing protein [Bryobacterales bacterium]
DRRLALPLAPGKRFALGIKNYNHRGRDAGLSNLVVVEIAQPVPAPAALTATAQAKAIRLDWPRVPGAWGYLIFKKTAAAPQFESLGRIQFPPFDDPTFTWETPYTYFVRAYAEVSTGIAESADSPQATLVPKDIFPPSPPAGLRAVVSETSVELSWDLSPEPDTAGYRVYRRESSGKNERLNAALLTAPVYSDKQVRRQQQYIYTVTAVDQNGNESAPGTPFTVTIP